MLPWEVWLPSLTYATTAAFAATRPKAAGPLPTTLRSYR